MPLIEVECSPRPAPIPDDVNAFLEEADFRVGEFVRNRPVGGSGFVPSDFVTVYQALRSLALMGLAPGNSFCEWGSGFGVVASLAAMLDFEAYGIEVDGELVQAARSLSEDFELPVEFAVGSFVPDGVQADVEEVYAAHNGPFWLDTDAADAYGELGLDPSDFDVVFAYPWPGETIAITDLFDAYAADGALLLMYDNCESVTLLRKIV